MLKANNDIAVNVRHNDMKAGSCLRNSGRWYWAFVPLLAVIAYITVLRIGFLSDDFIFLYNSQQSGIDLGVFVPEPHWYLYRPLGVVLVGQLGWQLWGYNPLGYHLVSLLLHAGSSLLLGLVVAEISSRRTLGWLAGALFAVFPLHLEAVGWMSAQWDAMSSFLGLLALWLFVIWWRQREDGAVSHDAYLYLSAFLYCLSIFVKESLLSFILIFPISAWAMTLDFNRARLVRLVYSFLPYLAALSINVGVRLWAWGFIGGYKGARTDYLNFFWDSYGDLIHMLLSPINSMIFGSATSQVVGFVTALGLLAAVIYHGYRERRLLIFSAAWVIFAVVPTLNLGVSLADLQQNRLLYLASAGYCCGVAVLLHALIGSAKRWRPAAVGLVGLIILGSIAVCWVQLRPWHTASIQVKDVDRQLSALLPPVHPGEEMVWFSENTPDNYQGAYSLRLGLGTLPYFRGGQSVTVNNVTDATDLNVLDKQDNAFAMRFRFDEMNPPELQSKNQEDTRYVIDYASGITGQKELPSASEGYANLQTWDLRDCSQRAVAAWTVEGAESSCNPDSGLTLSPTSPDPQAFSPTLSIPSGAMFIRVRALISYPPTSEAYISQWYWKGEGEGWSEERSLGMLLRQDGKPHVYWTYIPTNRAPNGVEGLRFDPVNGTIDTTVQWIVLDEVP
jgi:hypothetical protein